MIIDCTLDFVEWLNGSCEVRTTTENFTIDVTGDDMDIHEKIVCHCDNCEHHRMGPSGE